MKLYMKSLTLLLFLGTVASCNDSFLDQTQTSDLNRERNAKKAVDESRF